jgi:hypothetical protein
MHKATYSLIAHSLKSFLTVLHCSHRPSRCAAGQILLVISPRPFVPPASYLQRFPVKCVLNFAVNVLRLIGGGTGRQKNRIYAPTKGVV